MKTAVFFFLALAVSCGDERGTPNRDQQMPTADSMIDDNIAAVKLEQHDIDLYATRIGLSLITTGTGIRYRMLRNADAPDAKPDQWAKVNYRLELLNGDSAYASEPGYPESFHIGMDDVESGLHEAIQLMGPGDSALIVIPSYRAHGIIGDQDRIPMRSTVVYHLGLVSVSDRR